MSCNRITKPEFTKEQVAECKKCKHISGKKVWCCLFGCWIDGRSEILLPKRNILRPQIKPKVRRPQILTLEKIKADYEQAKAQMRKLGRGNEVITLDEYIQQRTKCKECNGGYKCPFFCCGLPTKLASKKFECKKGKL